MDKPLSQERLSEEDVNVIEYVLIQQKVEISYDSQLLMFAELKRLQAIELERDQYKLALEKLDAVLDFSDNIRTNEEIFIDDPTEINEALDFAYSLINPEQHAINKALEGAETNETH